MFNLLSIWKPIFSLHDYIYMLYILMFSLHSYVYLYVMFLYLLVYVYMYTWAMFLRFPCIPIYINSMLSCLSVYVYIYIYICYVLMFPYIYIYDMFPCEWIYMYDMIACICICVYAYVLCPFVWCDVLYYHRDSTNTLSFAYQILLLVWVEIRTVELSFQVHGNALCEC